ncbi:hypothetical protein AVEN_154657-1 [Araneus ventricosus]|uniref:Uncharacterized protein n=1 Tax=Araneus ventricosus TaxID=182803 RepID=A0A4Y2JP87_ARAVE|nr:hypothetical protein AVEN_154657-1 [Araneus ventricosus]
MCHVCSHGVTPVMSVGVPGTLNESRYDSSSTEAGVLVAITGHSPTTPEGDTFIMHKTITHEGSFIKSSIEPPPSSSWIPTLARFIQVKRLSHEQPIVVYFRGHEGNATSQKILQHVTC